MQIKRLGSVKTITIPNVYVDDFNFITHNMAVSNIT